MWKSFNQISQGRIAVRWTVLDFLDYNSMLFFHVNMSMSCAPQFKLFKNNFLLSVHAWDASVSLSLAL